MQGPDFLPLKHKAIAEFKAVCNSMDDTKLERFLRVGKIVESLIDTHTDHPAYKKETLKAIFYLSKGPFRMSHEGYEEKYNTDVQTVANAYHNMQRSADLAQLAVAQSAAEMEDDIALFNNPATREQVTNRFAGLPELKDRILDILEERPMFEEYFTSPRLVKHEMVMIDKIAAAFEAAAEPGVTMKTVYARRPQAQPSGQKM